MINPFSTDRLAEIEKQYGKRPRIAAGHGEPLQDQHFRGELADGRKFVYCPIGFIVSWHPEDYEHEYCAWCKVFYKEKGII